MKETVCAFISMLIVAASAYAGERTIGKGDSVSIDITGLPPEMLKAHSVMMDKCTRCHSSERVLGAVKTGVAPVTNTGFSKETAKPLVDRMVKKPDSNMTNDDAGMILIYLKYLLGHSHHF